MKGLVLLLALVAACFAGAQASEDPTGALEGVVDLTPTNFDTIVNGKKDALVEFYAPWCGHCKHLTPEYKKLGAAVLKDPKLKNRVVVAKVDADAHRSLGDRFGVKGFPTIKYFPRGQAVDKPNDYDGGRTFDAFLAYIKDALDADAGFARVEALDPLAAEFAGAADKAGALKELEGKVAKLAGDEKEHGELYVALAKKAVEKGANYFEKEHARLNRMLDSGSVAAAKVDDFSKKASVLSAFLPQTADDMADVEKAEE